jgi:hypothetical protein
MFKRRTAGNSWLEFAGLPVKISRLGKNVHHPEILGLI